MFCLCYVGRCQDNICYMTMKLLVHHCLHGVYCILYCQPVAADMNSSRSPHRHYHFTHVCHFEVHMHKTPDVQVVIDMHCSQQQQHYFSLRTCVTPCRVTACCRSSLMGSTLQLAGGCVTSPALPRCGCWGTPWRCSGSSCSFSKHGCCGAAVMARCLSGFGAHKQLW